MEATEDEATGDYLDWKSYPPPIENGKRKVQWNLERGKILDGLNNPQLGQLPGLYQGDLELCNNTIPEEESKTSLKVYSKVREKKFETFGLPDDPIDIQVHCIKELKINGDLDLNEINVKPVFLDMALNAKPWKSNWDFSLGSDFLPMCEEVRFKAEREVVEKKIRTRSSVRSDSSSVSSLSEGVSHFYTSTPLKVKAAQSKNAFRKGTKPVLVLEPQNDVNKAKTDSKAIIEDDTQSTLETENENSSTNSDSSHINTNQNLSEDSLLHVNKSKDAIKDQLPIKKQSSSTSSKTNSNTSKEGIADLKLLSITDINTANISTENCPVVSAKTTQANNVDINTSTKYFEIKDNKLPKDFENINQRSSQKKLKKQQSKSDIHTQETDTTKQLLLSYNTSNSHSNSKQRITSPVVQSQSHYIQEIANDLLMDASSFKSEHTDEDVIRIEDEDVVYTFKCSQSSFSSNTSINHSTGIEGNYSVTYLSNLDGVKAKTMSKSKEGATNTVETENKKLLDLPEEKKTTLISRSTDSRNLVSKEKTLKEVPSPVKKNNQSNTLEKSVDLKSFAASTSSTCNSSNDVTASNSEDINLSSPEGITTSPRKHRSHSFFGVSPTKRVSMQRCVSLPGTIVPNERFMLQCDEIFMLLRNYQCNEEDKQAIIDGIIKDEKVNHIKQRLRSKKSVSQTVEGVHKTGQSSEAIARDEKMLAKTMGCKECKRPNRKPKSARTKRIERRKRLNNFVVEKKKRYWSDDTSFEPENSSTNEKSTDNIMMNDKILSRSSSRSLRNHKLAASNNKTEVIIGMNLDEKLLPPQPQTSNEYKILKEETSMKKNMRSTRSGKPLQALDIQENFTDVEEKKSKQIINVETTTVKLNNSSDLQTDDPESLQFTKNNFVPRKDENKSSEISNEENELPKEIMDNSVRRRKSLRLVKTLESPTPLETKKDIKINLPKDINLLQKLIADQISLESNHEKDSIKGVTTLVPHQSLPENEQGSLTKVRRSLRLQDSAVPKKDLVQNENETNDSIIDLDVQKAQKSPTPVKKFQDLKNDENVMEINTNDVAINSIKQKTKKSSSQVKNRRSPRLSQVEVVNQSTETEIDNKISNDDIDVSVTQTESQLFKEPEVKEQIQKGSFKDTELGFENVKNEVITDTDFQRGEKSPSIVKYRRSPRFELVNKLNECSPEIYEYINNGKSIHISDNEKDIKIKNNNELDSYTDLDNSSKVKIEDKNKVQKVNNEDSNNLIEASCQDTEKFPFERINQLPETTEPHTDVEVIETSPVKAVNRSTRKLTLDESNNVEFCDTKNSGNKIEAKDVTHESSSNEVKIRRSSRLTKELQAVVDPDLNNTGKHLSKALSGNLLNNSKLDVAVQISEITNYTKANDKDFQKTEKIPPDLVSKISSNCDSKAETNIIESITDTESPTQFKSNLLRNSESDFIYKIDKVTSFSQEYEIKKECLDELDDEEIEMEDVQDRCGFETYVESYRKSPPLTKIGKLLSHLKMEQKVNVIGKNVSDVHEDEINKSTEQTNSTTLEILPASSHDEEVTVVSEKVKVTTVSTIKKEKGIGETSLYEVGPNNEFFAEPHLQNIPSNIITPNSESEVVDKRNIIGSFSDNYDMKIKLGTTLVECNTIGMESPTLLEYAEAKTLVRTNSEADIDKRITECFKQTSNKVNHAPDVQLHSPEEKSQHIEVKNFKDEPSSMMEDNSDDSETLKQIKRRSLRLQALEENKSTVQTETNSPKRSPRKSTSDAISSTNNNDVAIVEVAIASPVLINDEDNFEEHLSDDDLPLGFHLKNVLLSKNNAPISLTKEGDTDYEEDDTKPLSELLHQTGSSSSIADNKIKHESNNDKSTDNKTIKIEVKHESEEGLYNNKRFHPKSLLNPSVFHPGDLVWSRIGKYSYWPSIIIEEPETKLYHKRIGVKSSNMTYHVRFFADQGRRAWVKDTNLLSYSSPHDLDDLIDMLKDNKEFSTIFEACKVKPTWRSRWVLGVEEAENIKNKTYAEKEAFFLEILAKGNKKEQKTKVAAIKVEDDDSVKSASSSQKYTKRKRSIINVKEEPDKEQSSEASPRLRKRKKASDDESSETGSKASDESNMAAQKAHFNKNKLFRGVTKDRACQFCYKFGSDVNRCKGKCWANYHYSCTMQFLDGTLRIEEVHGLEIGTSRRIFDNVKYEEGHQSVTETKDVKNMEQSPKIEQVESGHTRSRSKVKKINGTSVGNVQIVTVVSKKNQASPVKVFPPNFSQMTLSEQIDYKMKEIMKKFDNGDTQYFESTDSSCDEAPKDLNVVKSRFVYSKQDDATDEQSELSRATEVNEESNEKKELQKLNNFLGFHNNECELVHNGDCILTEATDETEKHEVNSSEEKKGITESQDYIESETTQNEDDKEVEKSKPERTRGRSKKRKDGKQKSKKLGSDEVRKKIQHVTADTEIFQEEVATNVEVKNYKCGFCTTNTDPYCSACMNFESPTGCAVRQKCSVNYCGKYYHLECLKLWPQVSWHLSQTVQNNDYVDQFVCPAHSCHTCVSDDPRTSSDRRSPADKLARCMRCPAAYHQTAICVPAGSEIISFTQLVCPRHPRGNKKPPVSNTNWCFICSRGGNLVCCETCPVSTHASCVKKTIAPEEKFICDDCESGRFPLYDEVVWCKLGNYRWWPGIVLYPNEIPDNILKIPHNRGEFVVMFYGTYDHYWFSKGRTFLFTKGDKGGNKNQKHNYEQRFRTAIAEATAAYDVKKEFYEQMQVKLIESMNGNKPPRYVKLKINKPVGGVKQFDPNLSNTQACECDPTTAYPCGPDSYCLNRILMTECNPEICPAGERCCNQRFDKREYPPLVPCKTKERGWGLKSLSPIRKGQFVIEYVGEIIDDAEYQRRIKKMHECHEENYYFLTIDKDRMLDAGPKGNVARFMNHSCQPNCETQKWTVKGDMRVGLFALYDIPAETELTFNYNLECVGKEKKVCRCGAPNCTGFIGGKVNKADNVNTKPKKKIKNKKKNKPETVPQVPPCFICGQSGAVEACNNKNCTKTYHLNCLNLDKWPEGNKFICPWHNCNECSKRTIRCCIKCTNSYCPQHSEGNIRHDRQLGFVCSQHEPSSTSTREPQPGPSKVKEASSTGESTSTSEDEAQPDNEDDKNKPGTSKIKLENKISTSGSSSSEEAPSTSKKRLRNRRSSGEISILNRSSKRTKTNITQSDNDPRSSLSPAKKTHENRDTK